MSIDLLDRISLLTTKSNKFVTPEVISDNDPLFDDQPSVDYTPSDSQTDLFQPLPDYSTVLGICEDGLPLVLDLNDPKPGAILILGQQQTGKGRLLRSILYSACTTNSTDQLYFYLITPDPANHHDLGRLQHCYGVFSSYDKTACELIVELSALAEQRKSGRHLGVKCILAIDNLYELIKHQDFDVVNHLKWLYRFGASNGIWLVSTIETERTKLIEQELLSEQKTHILTGDPHLRLAETNHNPGSAGFTQSYHTQIGSQWVDFWLPSNH